MKKTIKLLNKQSGVAVYGKSSISIFDIKFSVAYRRIGTIKYDNSDKEYKIYFINTVALPSDCLAELYHAIKYVEKGEKVDDW